MRRHSGQVGFTLIELMIVVAIVGILAAVGVSAYRKMIRKSKASGEVPMMLGQFQQREEQYLNENGTYLATGTSDTDFYPKPLAGAGRLTDISAGMPTTWGPTGLRIQPGANGLYCGYVTLIGPGGTAPSGAGSVLWANPATPTHNWFYVRAECDWDGSTTANNIWLVRGDLSISTAVQTGEGR